MSFLTDLGGLLVSVPSAALLPGIAFLAAATTWRSRSAIVAGVGWVLYAGYEHLMEARLLCGGCTLRADLALIYPALVVATVLALLALFRRARQR
jgi:hypothetical protein